MPIARPETQDARVIARVDMDCFYVQVEQRKNPVLRGLPTAVVQYNSWKGGGLIAVGYEAREFGVKRSMRGDEAKKFCPNIQLVQVPVARGKADLSLYRDAGSEVVSILATKGRCERASIDEVYLDLTDAAELMQLESPPEALEVIDEEVLKSHILGLNDDVSSKENDVKEWLCQSDTDHRDKLLACGAMIVAQLRMEVLKVTTFTCSAGIAHNKMLAKLASAMHKPAQQTVVPLSSVKDLLASLPVKKMKQLGGKLGDSLQSELGVSTVGDLLQFSVEKLQEHNGFNTGTWLWNIARGISGEEVEGRLLPKSHGCGKTFPGPQALKKRSSVEHWINELCEKLSECIRCDLEKNRRVAHTLTLHARAFKASDLGSHKNFPSKSCPLCYGIAKIQEDALKLFESGLREFLCLQKHEWGVTSLSVTASKILPVPPGTCSILKFFNGNYPSSPLTKHESDVFVQDDGPLSPSGSEISLEQHQIERIKGPKHEEICNSDDTPHANKILQRGERGMTEQRSKETCSILKFFHGSSSTCSSKQVPDDLIHQCGKPMSPSGSESYSKPKNIDTDTTMKGVESRNGNTPHHEDQTVQRAEGWKLNAEDIDPSVLDELPLEIQREVRDWIRPLKRSNIAKRGPSIDQYFLPAKRF